MLRVNTVGESFEGMFDTIDDTGRLIVITPTGNRAASAPATSFRPAETAA